MRETLATILWEGWTALVLCAAAVFWPGSAALRYPAVLWPGLALAAAVPAVWAGWWMLAQRPKPLPEEADSAAICTSRVTGSKSAGSSPCRAAASTVSVST